ncbi:hypothetical protein GIS00_26515 [Nakamurella sp. YIM 132087]|uniref:Uncharacterized protein n=1 Tax=Nakamurella alba TaxID=2665158 RepID=A0A7K1FTJ0_9ACTN|nr:hypothetical protein [Nakamurella alba]MTD17487.1 hypothetical protein [Nakamurella alba]
MNQPKLRITGTRAVACLAIVATLMGAAAGAANAASPAAVTPAVHAPAPAPLATKSVGSTTGFGFVNTSSETFVYASKTGRVAAPPAVMTPGQVQSLQVPYNVFHNYDSSVTWDIDNVEGAQIGTLVADVNNAGEGALHFYNTSGGNLTSMTYQVINDANWIQDAKGSAGTAVTYTPGSTAEQAAIQNLCSQNVAQCTFTPDANSTPQETYGATPTQLAAEYNPTSDTGSVEAGKSQSYTVTDSWGVTATAQATIKALQAGIQATYGKSFASTTTWQTSSTQPVPAGSTTFIWGFAPVINYTGTWTIKVDFGPTTFTAPGVTYSVPDSSRPILYVPVTTPGDTVNNPVAPTLSQALPYASHQR